MMKTNYKCYIDSIQIRYNNLKLQPLYLERYNYVLEKNGIYKFKYRHNNKNYNIFEVENHKDNRGIEYQLLTFNGFKKYNERDDLIKKIFYEIIQLLKDNDITFFLNKIDLSIDFYDVDITDLFGIQKRKSQGVRRVLLEDLDGKSIDEIRTNKRTFYLEPTTKEKKRYQHSKIYNKSRKENLSSVIYRFEVVLSNFSNVEKIDILNYKNNLLDEIKHRYNKYSIEVFNEKIHFDFSLVEDIVNQTVRL